MEDKQWHSNRNDLYDESKAISSEDRKWAMVESNCDRNADSDKHDSQESPYRSSREQRN